MCKIRLLPLPQWACPGTDKICMTVCTGTSIGCTVMQTWTSTRTCRPQLLYIIGTWYDIGLDHRKCFRFNLTLTPKLFEIQVNYH